MANFNLIDEDFLEIELPHGSGIDGDWNIVRQKNGSWVCSNSFHRMNESGFYDGWTPFKVKFFTHQKDVVNKLHGPLEGKTQIVHRKGDADFKVLCRDRDLRMYLEDEIDAAFADFGFFECRHEIE